MYGGGSQLDPRDSIADTTPLSIIEAQKELEEIDSEEGEDMPKPLDMTEEELEQVCRNSFCYLVKKRSSWFRNRPNKTTFEKISYKPFSKPG